MGGHRRTAEFLCFISFALARTSFFFFACCPVNAQDTAFDLQGKSVDPRKVAGGKAVVLVFVRTDCPVANRYAPAIQKLSDANADKATFWLVYPSKIETAKQIRQHEVEYGYKIPALRDPRRVLVKESQVQVTPEAAVFDGKGRLVYHGRIDDLYVEIGRARRAPTTHDLSDAIAAAVSGKTLSPASTSAVGCTISDLE